MEYMVDEGVIRCLVMDADIVKQCCSASWVPLLANEDATEESFVVSVEAAMHVRHRPDDPIGDFSRKVWRHDLD